MTNKTKNKNILDSIREVKSNFTEGICSENEVKDFIKTCKTKLKKNRENIDSTSFLYNFFLHFNIENFCDMTILMVRNNYETKIIESVGDINLLKNISFRLNHGQEFYRKYKSIKYDSREYSLYHESMMIDDTEYTLLAFSESRKFMPSRFHTLADILMEYIRSSQSLDRPYYNDFFEETLVRLNAYLNENNSINKNIYLFKFDHNSFLHKTGVNTAIEFSESIEKKLHNYFQQSSGIFRISLTLFIVIIPNSDTHTFDMHITKAGHIELALNFVFNDIILVYSCFQIQEEDIKSSYDIFEKIYHFENN